VARPEHAPPPIPTREKILDVAEELIDRHGMEGLRLKEVARRVGIRPPSIFAHFEGREAVGNAVARRVVEQIVALFARVLDGPDEPVALVRRGVRAFAGHLHDHPAHVRLLLRDLARNRGGGELDLSSPFLDPVFERVEAILAEGVRGGVFRPVEAAAFVAAIEGFLLARIGWAGFDEEGQPVRRGSRAQLQDEACALALAFLRPTDGGPAASARPRPTGR
jgi:AcrR family transcriptional regulator